MYSPHDGSEHPFGWNNSNISTELLTVIFDLSDDLLDSRYRPVIVQTVSNNNDTESLAGWLWCWFGLRRGWSFVVSTRCSSPAGPTAGTRRAGAHALIHLAQRKPVYNEGAATQSYKCPVRLSPHSGFRIGTFLGLFTFSLSLYWRFSSCSPCLGTCLLFHFISILLFASFSPPLLASLGALLLKHLFPQFYRRYSSSFARHPVSRRFLSSFKQPSLVSTLQSSWVPFTFIVPQKGCSDDSWWDKIGPFHWVTTT